MLVWKIQFYLEIVPVPKLIKIEGNYRFFRTKAQIVQE